MLAVGLKNEMKWTVKEEHLASSLGSGLVEVLATPVLVGLCEECARLMVEPLLADGQKTVGTVVNLRHMAATPVGMQVTVHAELVGIDDKRLRFRIEAWDEVERVAKAEHERFIIDADRFARRIAEKRRESETPIKRSQLLHERHTSALYHSWRIGKRIYCTSLTGNADKPEEGGSDNGPPFSFILRRPVGGSSGDRHPEGSCESLA